MLSISQEARVARVWQHSGFCYLGLDLLWHHVLSISQETREWQSCALLLKSGCPVAPYDEYLTRDESVALLCSVTWVWVYCVTMCWVSYKRQECDSPMFCYLGLGLPWHHVLSISQETRVWHSCVLLLGSGCTVAPHVLLLGSGFTVAPCVDYLTKDKSVAVLCSVTWVWVYCGTMCWVSHKRRVWQSCVLLLGSGFTVLPCVEYLTRDKSVTVLCSVTWDWVYCVTMCWVSHKRQRCDSPVLCYLGLGVLWHHVLSISQETRVWQSPVFCYLGLGVLCYHVLSISQETKVWQSCVLLFGSGSTVAPCVEYLTRDKTVLTVYSADWCNTNWSCVCDILCPFISNNQHLIK